MKRRDFNLLLAAAVTPAVVAKARNAGATAGWSLKANVAECCGCEIPCPCNFGRPTELRCDGNRLVDIYEGQVDGADLAGVRFVVTFEMGKWSRIYADDRMNDAQMKAFEAIMPLAFGFFHNQALSVERVPVTVDRTGDAVRFSTPESAVEMKPLVGMNGERITINGLPSNAFHEYVQYESVKHTHTGHEREWSYSGTNGFTSRMLASG